MEIKMFEIRDKGTFIPALAIKLGGRELSEMYLLSRAGYGSTIVSQMSYIILVTVETMKCQYDPFKWGDRTMQTAHKEIERDWDSYQSGEVIDVEFILGETDTKKVSEIFTTPY